MRFFPKLSYKTVHLATLTSDKRWS